MAKTVMQKTWYEIVAPGVFGNEAVAETPAEEPESVLGRTIKLGLQDVMPSSDKYYMDIYLQVIDVEGNTAQTKVVGHNVSKEYISKMIGRRSNRIDIVEDVETADGETVRVKVVATTIRKTNSSKLRGVRQTVTGIVTEAAADHKLESFMEQIFTGTLQDRIVDQAGDIYPLRDLEIRRTDVQ